MASRRDGRPDRKQADVSMARRRSRRRDPRRPGSAPARPARGRQAHAQADAKAGVRAKKVVTDKLRSYGAAFQHLRLTPADRARLQSIIRDRNSPQKHVWRAWII